MPPPPPRARRFYTKLFELEPEVRDLFKKDIKRQGRALVMMMNGAIRAINQTETTAFQTMIRALARRHAGYGVKPSYFEAMGHCIMHAFDVTLSDEVWTVAAQHAWITLYSVICQTMIPELVTAASAAARPSSASVREQHPGM